MRAGLRCLFAGWICFAACAACAQETVDQHFADAAKALYERSAFAHGYIHGYEDGFHLADIDIQMGHMLPGVRTRHDAGSTDARYRSEYGDKGLFMAGYRAGARTGYSDSLSGREFRAISELREAARGLDPAQPGKHFDRAFSDGYLAGEKYGASDAVLVTDFGYVGAYCRTQIKRDDAARGQYCDAYLRGYQIGYADGRDLQNTNGVETAENKK